MPPPVIPTAMHAWTHTTRGHPSRVLHLTSNAPVRHPKSPNELLIKISHAALNPGGLIMMHLVPFVFRHSPAVPEMDFSGTVVSIGPESETDSLLQNDGGDHGFQIGDGVFGSIGVPEHVGGGHGALAEYVVVQASNCVKRPEGAKMEELAGLGVAGCTALVLVQNAGLKRGNRVLINAASGGIGSLVVQMVRGAVGESGFVVGICAGRNEGFARGLGVNEVVDHVGVRSVPAVLAERYGNNKFEIVIDALGVQNIWDNCASYLVEDGPFVTVGIAFQDYTLPSILYSVWLFMVMNPYTPTWLGGVSRKYIQITGFVNENQLQELGRQVQEGKLKGVVDSVWEMEDVKKAYGIILHRRARGKVVVKIGEE